MLASALFASADNLLRKRVALLNQITSQDMRVLVVDDERQMTEQLQKGLQREGYSVMVAGDGASALNLIRDDAFDLVLLDWMLPKLDGRQVARLIRQEGIVTRILMLTARDSTPEVVEGLDCGADDYLCKPFAFEVLLARMRALLRRSPETQAPVLRVLDLSLDATGHRVLRGNRDLSLTNTEFNLLHLLMRRRGRVVARESLISTVWGSPDSIENNTLDAFIRLLRRKVDAEPYRKLIHTVRGVGYCLRETAPP